MARDPHGRFARESTEERPHGYQRYYRGCRCGVCREGVRVHTAERRAAKRTLTPVAGGAFEPAAAGPCVAAVRAALAVLNLGDEWAADACGRDGSHLGQSGCGDVAAGGVPSVDVGDGSVA
jgi:hypothetical protein